MSKTFEVHRANNPRLHNLLNQGDQYKAYLKRIQTIVYKKPMQDTSSKFYMTFLHKTKYVSRHHKNIQNQSQIGLQNRHLLDKIVKAKNRKSPQNNSPTYSLAMYEKRYRQQQKINQQNKQIAKRITQQYSLLRKRNNLSLHRSTSVSPSKASPRNNGQSWHFDNLKARKLPKLINHLRS